ncbi:MAG: hypothetical protein AUH88_05035 [Acidobacteria bacterium 13_1_40CM_4_61_5]|nr:MAG: hypothetical protein AUH88_05035 [Acidobacteria bacterium 13_1_40CM_4_61_5]
MRGLRENNELIIKRCDETFVAWPPDAVQEVTSFFQFQFSCAIFALAPADVKHEAHSDRF